MGRQPGALWAAVAAVGFMVIGSLGPWAKAVFASKAGVEGDGIIVLFLAGVAAVCLWRYVQRGARGALVVAAAAGVLSLAIGIYDFADVSSTNVELFGEETDLVQVGWGLYVTVLASAGLVAACVVLRRMAPAGPVTPGTADEPGPG